MRKTEKKVIAFLLALVLLTGLAALTALADGGEIAWGAATVDTAALNIRSGPSTDDERVGIISGGTIVVILEKTTKEWYKVNYAGTVGYVASEYLTDILEAENFKATGTITGDKVRMRKGPSTEKDVITTYDTGTTCSVIGINHGWYKVVTEDGTGYIRSDYMDITGGGPSYTSVKSETVSLGQQIANYALKFVGYKYVYGEESPASMRRPSRLGTALFAAAAREAMVTAAVSSFFSQENFIFLLPVSLMIRKTVYFL